MVNLNSMDARGFIEGPGLGPERDLLVRRRAQNRGPSLGPRDGALLSSVQAPEDIKAGARLTFPVALAEKGGDEKKVRTFTGLAYSGAIVDLFFSRLIIELDGIQLPKKAIPALLEHSTIDRIGKTAKGGGFELSDRGLEVAGELLSNATARGVVADADEGFPWELSIYIKPAPGRGVEWIDEGETAVVNGQEVAGPLAIYRKSVVREVSFVALGADEKTEAQVLSGKSPEKGSGTMPKTMTEDENKKLVEEAVAAALSEAGDQHKTALEAAELAARDGERARTSAILEACGPTLGKLAADLVKDGDELEGALLKINKALHDSRTAEEARLADINAAHGTPAGPAPKPEEETAWAKLSDEMRAEFLNDQSLFEAYEKNKGLVSGKLG